MLLGGPGKEKIDFRWSGDRTKVLFFELLDWFRMVLRGFKEDLAGFMTFQVTWKGPQGINPILDPPTVGRAGASRESPPIRRGSPLDLAKRAPWPLKSSEVL